MDFFRDVDLEKCAAIQNRIAEYTLKSGDIDGLYWKLTPSMLQQLLDAGSLDYYKECINGYLNAVFGLENMFVLWHNTHPRDLKDLRKYEADTMMPVTKRSANSLFYRKTIPDSNEENEEERDMKTKAECPSSRSRSKLTKLLVSAADNILGFSEVDTRRQLSQRCQEEIDYILERRKIEGLGKVYTCDEYAPLLFVVDASKNWLFAKRISITVNGQKKCADMNPFHKLYFFDLPPLLMTGDLLTAYARLTILHFFVRGIQRKSIYPLILQCLTEYYPLHYQRFMHYFNSFPRFPLYSMAARDYDRLSKKRTEFLKSVRAHLWRPGGDLAMRLESLCH